MTPTLEPLEPRLHQAVAAFTFDAPPVVQVGERFQVAIVAREFDPLVAGLQAVALTVAWDAAILELVSEPQITQHLPMHRPAELQPGRADLAAASFPAGKVGRPIGNLRPEVFATLEFEAVAPGAARLSMRQGPAGIATQPVGSLSGSQLRFEREWIAAVDWLVPRKRWAA